MLYKYANESSLSLYNELTSNLNESLKTNLNFFLPLLFFIYLFYFWRGHAKSAAHIQNDNYSWLHIIKLYSMHIHRMCVFFFNKKRKLSKGVEDLQKISRY